MEKEEEYEDKLNWYEDKVGVGIVATPRSYKYRQSQLRRKQLCTKEEDGGD